MAWQDELRTGNVLVDDQHRQLFKVIDELGVAVRERRAQPALLLTLRALKRYVQEHFTAEEQLMARTAYPGLAAHRALHFDMRLRSEELAKGFLGGDLVLPFTLVQFLSEWLTSHIRTEDLAFSRWLAEEGATPGAVRPAGRISLLHRQV